MKTLIINYIQNLKVEDVENFIKKNQYSIPKKDIDIIFRYIKEKGRNVIEGDCSALEEIKKEVEVSTYMIIMDLYNKYRCYLG